VNPNLRRVALIAASLGLLVSLFVALRSDGDDETATPPTTTTQEITTRQETVPLPTTESATTAEQPTVTVEPPPPASARVTIRLRVTGGQPAGGIRRPKVKQGRKVVIVTTSDVADHIHLHGYDLMADVAPGRPARIRFTADTPGRFEVELEDRGVQIADLEVRP